MEKRRGIFVFFYNGAMKPGLKPGPKSGFTLTVAQPTVDAEQLSANALEHARLIKEAPASLVAFPELSFTGYSPSVAPIAIDSLLWHPIVEACAETGSVALVGAPIEDETGRSIAAVRVDAQGPSVVYRKVALTEEELAHFIPGTGPAVIDVDGVRVGVAICMDVWTNSVLGAYAGLPMDIFVAGLLTPEGEEQDAHELGAQIARTFGIPVAFAQYGGHSAIYDADTDPDTTPVEDLHTVILAQADSNLGTAVTHTFI